MLFEITNFRSIHKQEVELKPLTVIYGPNGAGKSSLLYSLFTLRNILLNSNQAVDGFFNFGFASLGPFEAVVFDHDPNLKIRLKMEFPEKGKHLSYMVEVSKTQVHFELHAGDPYNFALSLSPSLPYPGNQPVQHAYKQDGATATVTWNGFLAQVDGAANPESQNMAQVLVSRLNSCTETIRRIDMVPLKRGFTKPSYSTVGMTPMLMSEDEVATFLANNKYLRGKVSYYLEQIVGRSFTVGSTPGTAIFSLDSMDKACGITTELVNDGFGVNQLVYLLTKTLHPETSTICIEEPEINLHPTAIRRLAQVLTSIAQKENKRFVISTHSEPFVLALLTLVQRKKLEPDFLACYLTQKNNKETTFDLQAVEPTGQIKGGLRSFMEGELEDLKEFLGITEEVEDERENGTASRD